MPRKVSKSSLTKKLDNAWSELVKKRAKYKCEVCGKTDTLNSHHIVGRVNRTLRWDVKNGVCLCVKHHKFGRQSAHEDPLWFKEWLEDKRWEDYAYLYTVKDTITKWTLEDMQELLSKLKQNLISGQWNDHSGLDSLTTKSE